VIPSLVLHADPFGLLVAFGAGMLSFVSPCVLPMVPGYVSMVSGLSAAQLGALKSSEGSVTRATHLSAAEVTQEAPTTREILVERGVLLRGILLFIAGFTTIFVILGASASALSQSLLLHKETLTTISGVLVVTFGGLMITMALGVRLPMFITGDRRFSIRPSSLGTWAPPLMGMAFAFAWTPCVSPVLGSVLALAAGTGRSASGGVALLLAYSLGLGVPFLLFGLAFGRMTDFVARIRGGLRYIYLGGGSILVIFGLLLLTGQVSVISTHVSAWLNTVHLGWLGNV